MIVCSCNVLSEHDVRAAIAAEPLPRSAGEIYECLGCRPRCGRCASTLRNILADVRAQMSELGQSV
jgi:bacterioferritin-associated ferredoxin